MVQRGRPPGRMGPGWHASGPGADVPTGVVSPGPGCTSSPRALRQGSSGSPQGAPGLPQALRDLCISG